MREGGKSPVAAALSPEDMLLRLLEGQNDLLGSRVLLYQYLLHHCPPLLALTLLLLMLLQHERLQCANCIKGCCMFHAMLEAR